MSALVLQLGLAYLLGGIMGGDVARRMSGGVDLRRSGSGNVGASNALRTRGPVFALAVLLFDVGKGACAVLLIPRLPMPMAATMAPEVTRCACGLSVAVGHCYPLLARFKGGKGVATLAGVFAVLLPLAMPWMVLSFVLVLLLTGYASLSSVAGAATGLLWVACVSGQGLGSAVGALAAGGTALVVFKHRGNLLRIARGSEARFERARLLGNWIDRWRAH